MSLLRPFHAYREEGRGGKQRPKVALQATRWAQYSNARNNTADTYGTCGYVRDILPYFTMGIRLDIVNGACGQKCDSFFDSRVKAERISLLTRPGYGARGTMTEAMTALCELRPSARR